MPPKKTSKSLPASSEPSMPAWKPAALPMATATSTSTSTTPTVLLGTGMIVAVCLMAVFGSVFASGMNGLAAYRAASVTFAAYPIITSNPSSKVLIVGTPLALTAKYGACGASSMVYHWFTQIAAKPWSPNFAYLPSNSNTASVNYGIPGTRNLAVQVACNGKLSPPLSQSYPYFNVTYIPKVNINVSSLITNNSDNIPKMLSNMPQAIKWSVLDQATNKAPNPSLDSYGVTYNAWMQVATSSDNLADDNQVQGIPVNNGLPVAGNQFNNWQVSSFWNGYYARIEVCITGSGSPVGANGKGICGYSAPFKIVSSISCSNQYKVGDINQDGRVADGSDNTFYAILQNALNTNQMTASQEIAMFPCLDAYNKRALNSAYKFNDNGIDMAMFINCNLAGANCSAWPLPDINITNPTISRSTASSTYKNLKFNLTYRNLLPKETQIAYSAVITGIDGSSQNIKDFSANGVLNYLKSDSHDVNGTYASKYGVSWPIALSSTFKNLSNPNSIVTARYTICPVDQYSKGDQNRCKSQYVTITP